MKQYFQFIRNNLALLGFGFLSVFWGNFGQSFFISWLGSPIQASLQISSSHYGSAYSLATLASACVVVWAGSRIDRVSIKVYAIAISCGLAIATLVLAAAQSFYLICIGFFLLRLFGQALLPHTGITTMARYFEENRGKAISIAGSGVPVGEIILPLLAVFLISWVGWRFTLVSVALLSIAFYIPVALYCISRSGIEPASNKPEQKSADESTQKKASGIKILLRDKRYWMALPGLAAAPFIITGVFIHQNFIIEEKAWTPIYLASCFVVYGVVHWLASIVSGILVDRFRAVRLLPIFLSSLVAAQLLIAYCDGMWVAPVFMSLLGMCIGLAQPITGALWAEVYGTEIIGAVRSVNVAAMVFSSSLSPILIGLMIDANLSLQFIFSVFAVITLFANVLMYFAYREPIVS